jgi:hypothetical protein
MPIALERPYCTPAEREEALPFRIRLASGPQDLRRAVEIRASAYGRHLPHIGEILRTAEAEDHRSDVLLLIAERKLDRRLIGTMRLEPNIHGALGVESETTLPDRYWNRRLVETTRLGVENGSTGTMVMAALVKAAFEICHACAIDDAIAVGRRSMAEMFRSMCFDEVAGPVRMSYANRTPLWIFAIPISAWESRLRERGHFYFDFMARTKHPDIDLDFDAVFEAFGMS